MFGTGRNLIANLDYKGKKYNYCAYYDPDLRILNTQFIDGDWQGSVVVLLWSSTWIHIPDLSKDPEQLVRDTISQLNEFLKKQFGGEVPVTWEEKFEYFLRKIVFFLEENIPQVKISD